MFPAADLGGNKIHSSLIDHSGFSLIREMGTKTQAIQPFPKILKVGLNPTVSPKRQFFAHTILMTYALKKYNKNVLNQS